MQPGPECSPRVGIWADQLPWTARPRPPFDDHLLDSAAPRWTKLSFQCKVERVESIVADHSISLDMAVELELSDGVMGFLPEYSVRREAHPFRGFLDVDAFREVITQGLQ